MNKKLLDKILRTASVTVAGAVTCAMFAGCNVNRNKLKDGLTGLGDAVGGAYTETSVASETEATQSETETEEAESETIAPTATPEPTATPTPLPTPTPSPERVDFSDLTTTKITDNFSVNAEAFSESTNTETDVNLATFKGKRMVVKSESGASVSEAINLILDGFYQEAAGLYTRYGGEAKAAYSLAGSIDSPYVVEVNYEYSYNARILSVIMSHKVMLGEDVIETSEEYASFDMLTGQFVTIPSVAQDFNGLEGALKNKLAKDAGIKNAASVTDLFVAAQQPGAQTATIVIYGKSGDTMYHTTADMNEYQSFLNRYGRMVYATGTGEEA